MKGCSVLENIVQNFIAIYKCINISHSYYPLKNWTIYGGKYIYKIWSKPYDKTPTPTENT